MSNHVYLDLAEKLETADAINRELDRDIFHLLVMNGRSLTNDEQNILETEHRNGLYWLRHIAPFTKSVDEALKLAGKEPSDILRKAWSNLSKRFSLHMCYWPEDKIYSEYLARYIVAEILKSKAEQPLVYP